VAVFGASGRIEAVQVAMLGPLEVRTGPDPTNGDVVEVGGARLRALLIMLALQPGRLVTSGQLIDGLWADDSPAGAANALQALVSRLRRAVPEAAIESRPTGYQLRLDPRCTDVVRFEELAAAGRTQLKHDPAVAAATLREALALWRGQALADVAETDFGRAAIARLDELRLNTLEHRVDAELRTGPPASLVAELEGLVIAYPMRETLAARLMRALQLSGRRGAALEVYEQTRQRLVEQLGIQPSPELAALHLEILRADNLSPSGKLPPASEPPPANEPPAGKLPAAGNPRAASHPRAADEPPPADEPPVGREPGHHENPSNLRAELTSFVGRDTELAQVAELLRVHRLVTLTGPGGAGKTRLAVEAARAELGATQDGVWLVELAQVTDPAEVASAVLGALGLREQALLHARRTASSLAVAADEQADALGRLLPALAARRALLVLDNCEHLVGAAADLADRILAACPRMRILATSREPLAITGEALWAVGPLTLPPDPAVSSEIYAERAVVSPAGQAASHRETSDRETTDRETSDGETSDGETSDGETSDGETSDGETSDGETSDGETTDGGTAAVADYASVRLLAQRARAVLPGFEVTQANAPAVARICRALDGMPLAIELAAARLRTMAPEQVAGRLDDRFRLLTGGSRTAVPRHQTLRAVVDWSWDLLDGAERMLWRRFSVFTGGATLEAAEQVCAGPANQAGQVGQAGQAGQPGLAAGQVLDLLTALADKSLLTVRHGPDGARYRMLEIIRAYGQDRLTEAGEQDALREAHARYFTGLAEAGVHHLRGAEQLDWLGRLSDDQDNVHAAIRAAVAAGDGRTAVGLAAPFGWYWLLRSMKVEGSDLIAEAVEAPRGKRAPTGRDTERLAVAYATGALLAVETPRQDRAKDWFARAAELAAAIPDPQDPVIRVVGPVGAHFGAFFTGTGPVPPGGFDDAVADPEPWVSAAGRVLRGHVTVNYGRDHAQAEEDFLVAAGTFEALGDRWGRATALGGLAMLESMGGEYAAAVSHYLQAAELAAELGTVDDELSLRLLGAHERWLLGEGDTARAELAAVQHSAERIGLPQVLALAAYTAGDMARLDGQPDVARAQLLRAVELTGPGSMDRHLYARVASGLGYLAGAAGDMDAARGWHAEALAVARLAADAPVIGAVLIGLADLALLEACPDRAAELLGASFAIRGTTDRSVEKDEERVAAHARAALGDARYDNAYQRGQCVTLDTLAGWSASYPALEGPDGQRGEDGGEGGRVKQ
jgi:predicted ATPase/DNA-binding SARP family transcriptional activator